uniref:R3H domain-containing protein n=1 Tax=Corethrella appendiculata TaxID=1370023 RepID=U5EK95_9DIPT
MDLLGSILNSMDKPPVKDKKERELMQKHKKNFEIIQNHEREKLNHFRKYCEERIGRLIKDPNRNFMEFQPLDKVYRTVVHDVAEIAGLVGMSFGIEGEDRYIVVYKKDHLPCEDEIQARKNGEIWNEETAKEYARKRNERIPVEEVEQKGDRENSMDKETKQKITPQKNYKDKYVHLVGSTSALEAARKTESKQSYGCVPSANKKDIRSIEQTMNDIQAKKKLKTTHNSYDAH